MSYSTDLAKILVNFTHSLQMEVIMVDDGIHAYMIDYARRGVSGRTMFTAFVDLNRYSLDIAKHENAGVSVPLQMLKRQVIEAHLVRFALGVEIKTIKKPSPHTVERRRRVVKACVRWLVSEGCMKHNPTEKVSTQPLRERFPSVWSLRDVEKFLKTFCEVRHCRSPILPYGSSCLRKRIACR